MLQRGIIGGSMGAVIVERLFVTSGCAKCIYTL